MHDLKRTRAVLDLGMDNASVPHTPSKKPAHTRRRKRPMPSGPAFDATPSEVDPRWIDLPENEPVPGEFRSGPRADQLARMITRACYPSGQEPGRNNRFFRCIASSVCGWRQKNWDRQLPRIYKHATRCSVLRRWKPMLCSAAEAAFASMAPGGFQTVAPTNIQFEESQTLIDVAPTNPFAKFDITEGLTQSEQLDHAIASLICASGSPARLVDYPQWSRIFSLVNPELDYSPPLSSYMRDRLIPAEAQRAVLHMRDYLRGQWNLSISFDGFTAGEQPIYTVHICTPERDTFLYYADIFYGSHTSDYMVDLLERVINEVGRHRFASIVSDDTNATKKARRLLTDRHTSILNLADPIHKLNLCIQDICLDRLWTSALQRLRKLLTHFKMSTYATGKLNSARKALGILRGLQSIGNTRFATVYYAATSVLANLPALYKIYRDCEVDTTGTPLPDIVADAIDESSVTAIEFKLALTELINILEPFARALLCLESTHSTLSDVYFFWLSALASLRLHFASNHSLLPPETKSRIQSIVFRRFNEAINDAPTDTYLTAFFLDPRYRRAAIYVTSIESQVQPPVSNSVTDQSAGSNARSPQKHLTSRLTEPLFLRIRKQLLSMLRAELIVAESIPDHPLHAYSSNALEAKGHLCEQLDVYYRADKLPFQSPVDEHKPAIQYWRQQREFHQTFLLAYLAEKMFSVLPNSMCDERSGSRLTQMYSNLRTRLDAKSMVEQIQFTQWDELVQGTQSRKTRLPTSFRDIPHIELPENQVDNDPSVLAAALTDEIGDSWLEPLTPLPVPQTTTTSGKSSEMLDLFSENHIDMTSQLLVNALSTTSPPDTSEMGAGDGNRKSLDRHSAVDPGQSAIRAADISWD